MSLLPVVLVFSVVFGAAFTSTCPRECPTYWTSYGSYCYRLFGSPQTWHQAEGRCQRSYSGRTPHLVSIHSYGENTFIKHLMETLSSNTGEYHYWIGLNELYQHGHYAWSDGTGRNYNYWQPGEPNNYKGRAERCVEYWKISNKLGWNDSPCSNTWSYICKMQK